MVHSLLDNWRPCGSSTDHRGARHVPGVRMHIHSSKAVKYSQLCNQCCSSETHSCWPQSRGFEKIRQHSAKFPCNEGNCRSRQQIRLASRRATMYSQFSTPGGAWFAPSGTCGIVFAEAWLMRVIDNGCLVAGPPGARQAAISGEFRRPRCGDTTQAAVTVLSPAT